MGEKLSHVFVYRQRGWHFHLYLLETMQNVIVQTLRHTLFSHVDWLEGVCFYENLQ